MPNKMQMKIDWLEDKPLPGPHQIIVLIIHTILSLAGSRKERRCNIREAKKINKIIEKQFNTKRGIAFEIVVPNRPCRCL